MKTIGFANGHLLINLVEQVNFAPGDDVIMWEQNEDLVKTKKGADGKLAVSVTADKSGKLTVKYMATSPSHKYLNGLANLQRNAATLVPIQALYQDTYRQDRVVGTNGVILTRPKLERGGDVSEPEWVFEFERVDFLFGDPAFAGLATAVAEAT